MALTFLADTSVLQRLGSPAVREVIESLASAGRLERALVTDLDVGYSTRNVDEWDRLLSALAAFQLIDTTAAHLQRARQVQRQLAQRSQRGRRIPDTAHRCAAEELDLRVVHDDADFDLIAAVTGQRSQWVVPAGSVD